MVSKEEMRIRKARQNQTRAEKSVTLVLNGALQNQIEMLELELIELRKEDAAVLAGNPAAILIAQKIDTLIAQAEESKVVVLIRQMDRRVWSDLKLKYPASDPRIYLYDNKIFDEAVPLCWAGPVISDDLRDQILGELSGGQWDQLCKAVQDTNGDVSVPFSALATRVLQGSVASEQQPAPTE